MRFSTLVILSGCTLLVGCQTAARGTTDTVKIFVSPSSAKVTTSLGQTCTSPCSLKVKRRKKFTVTASKRGYAPQTVKVGIKLDKKSALKTAGSFIVPGGSALVAVDAITRANYDHYPNPVRIKLKRHRGS